MYRATVFLALLLGFILWTGCGGVAVAAGAGTVIFSDGFESGTINPANWNQQIGGGAIAVNSGCHSGNWCAQLKIISGGNNLISYCSPHSIACPQANSSNPDLPADYYTSHWVKMGSPFSFGNDYFKWVYNTTGGLTCYYDGQEQAPPSTVKYIRVICDFTPAPFHTLSIGYDTVWHHLEQHISSTSGIYEIWWDGQYVGSTSGSIGQMHDFRIGVYLNGTPTVNANPEYLYLDDIKICTGGRCP